MLTHHSLQRVVSFSAALAVVTLLACGREPSPAVVAPSGAELCAADAQAASTRFRSVAATVRTCVVDADCTNIPLAASCFDGCTTVIARVGQPTVDAVVADLNAHECQEFKQKGCVVVVPPCVPPRNPTCTRGVCG